ncbi:MAG TPA: dehydrogenase [Planctomycetaceae bacterium]|nr:Gfo/Idh/MocA family oxidoreductase [Planctomycetales bacterium]HAA60500.1 dehydrogenase [Planctomycetaceae bacterium]|tara:strand:- start:4603 stop:5919 length:1317 start_codon:yes stop_codon:yes gene_type:complete
MTISPQTGSTRRDFLQTSAAMGTAFWVASDQESWAAPKSPNEKIRFACIGVGGKGSSDSADAGRHGDVVAICDVDSNTLNKAGNRFKNAKKFNDYRDMLTKMADSIDAVTVSIPDHNHAPASAMAMKLGKHCFTQKPMTHSIYEARQMAILATKNKVQTQMGNQGTASSKLREGAAIVQSGVLGQIKEVHVWTNRPVWPQGGPRPKAATPPKHLNWDAWLGPAPERPYGNGYHPFAWRGWWDFGTGALGDMACHTMNMPFMALNLKDPISVEATNSGHNKDSYPKSSVITYEFPKLGERNAVKMIWYDGGERPAQKLLPKEHKVPRTGSLLIGDKGMLLSPGDYASNSNIVIGVDTPKVDFEKSPGHFTEYARAITDGKPARSNFPEYAGPLTEVVLLGNLAVWAEKKVEWDAKTLTPKNAPEVKQIVRREYRKGWTL